MTKNDFATKAAFKTEVDAGGEPHQSVLATGQHNDESTHLTTNQGLRVSAARARIVERIDNGLGDGGTHGHFLSGRGHQTIT